jgi:hypothetical protein
VDQTPVWTATAVSSSTAKKAKLDVAGRDDDKREYAYGPAQGLPDTKVGTFTQALQSDVFDVARARASPTSTI